MKRDKNENKSLIFTQILVIGSWERPVLKEESLKIIYLMLLRSFTLVTDINIQWHRKRMWMKQQQIFAIQAKFNAFALGQKKPH